MKGYVVANIVVTDPERYALYRAAAPAVIARFGGRYLVRAPEIQTVEGDLRLERFVILEFDSLAQAHTFYYSPEYQAVAVDRVASSRSDFILVEGCLDPPETLRRDSKALA